jgi:hypothetical protein
VTFVSAEVCIKPRHNFFYGSAERRRPDAVCTHQWI